MSSWPVLPLQGSNSLEKLFLYINSTSSGLNGNSPTCEPHKHVCCFKNVIFLFTCFKEILHHRLPLVHESHTGSSARYTREPGSATPCVEPTRWNVHSRAESKHCRALIGRWGDRHGTSRTNPPIKKTKTFFPFVLAAETT